LDRLDVHNRRRRLELAIEGVKASPRISERNKKALLDFCNYCFAEGLTVDRVEHLLRCLKKTAEIFWKDFEEATKDDIVDLVRRIESRRISAWTKHDYRVTLKKFYKWLKGNGEEYPEEVKWIKTRNAKTKKLPEELLTERDVEKLIKAAANPQMKAIVATLWETGMRAGELLNLRIRHIEPEEKYARLIVDGKTGMRRVIALFAWPYLIQWLNIHPYRDDPDAPLWINVEGKPLLYPALRKKLMELGRKAGIKKKVNPHQFRHSRATYLSRHLTEAQLSQYLGWVQGSRMPQIYVHMSSRDLVEPLLSLYGLGESGKPKQPKLKPTICWKCRRLNPADAGVCTSCGSYLNLETAIKVDEERKRKLEELSTKLEEERNLRREYEKRLVRVEKLLDEFLKLRGDVMRSISNST
jgi:integrase/ribosomal protein L40E